ncbi:MAG: adenylate/guanylate cyclase domain-containing protein [Caldithrix sp.]|nr:MAG: adenylate/guanylate cyclase domain-containing protein [Caldithrix sp.]
MDSQNENKLLRDALGMYAGEHVLEMILKDGEKALERFSNDAELTLVFVDVLLYTENDLGFSSGKISEILGEYYEMLTRTVVSHDGIFDSFVGDSGSAFWGIDGKKSHPSTACSCAIDLAREIDALNKNSTKNNLPSIKLKIGINTGSVRLGNFGSSDRIKYTVMGGAINLASRLCGLAFSDQSSTILISEMTRKRLISEIETEHFDTVHVKGISEQIGIYKIAF